MRNKTSGHCQACSVKAAIGFSLSLGVLDTFAVFAGAFQECFVWQGPLSKSVCELAKPTEAVFVVHASSFCAVHCGAASWFLVTSLTVSHGESGDIMHSRQRNQIHWTADQLLGAQLCLFMFCILRGGLLPAVAWHTGYVAMTWCPSGQMQCACC